MSDQITIAQEDVVRRLLFFRLQASKCLCHVRENGTLCARCELIGDAKKAFPEATIAALELYAMFTPGARS